MALSKAAQMFSSRELAQLDVYGLWAVLRWQLNTDDSFTFNKARPQPSTVWQTPREPV